MNRDGKTYSSALGSELVEFRKITNFSIQEFC